MRRISPILLAVVVVLAAGLIIGYWAERQERAVIRARHQQLRTALASRDTNAVLALIAPQYRKGFDDGRLMRMDDFAVGLGPRSKMLILGKQATLWPGPNRILCGVWPIGDTVEMTKVGGTWFFTGKVHLD